MPGWVPNGTSPHAKNASTACQGLGSHCGTTMPHQCTAGVACGTTLEVAGLVALAGLYPLCCSEDASLAATLVTDLRSHEEECNKTPSTAWHGRDAPTWVGGAIPAEVPTSHTAQP